MSNITQKLQELNITLPTPAAPVDNYVGFTKSGNQVIISGQLPLINGKLEHIGKVPSQISEESAKEAAKICAINILAQLNTACQGNLDKVEKCLKLGFLLMAILILQAIQMLPMAPQI